MQLLLEILDDPHQSGKRILVLEKDEKNTNDRTWCFWETGKGRFDHLLEKTWEKGEFHSDSNSYVLDLPPYSYKMLRSSMFYSYVRDIVSKNDNVEWVKHEVNELSETKDEAKLIVDNQELSAQYIFDSRVSDSIKNSDSHINLLQHFKGWFIKTEKAVFDESSFVMMDYRFKLKDTTSFMYVLPIAEDTALVEFTFFNEFIVEDSVYDTHLKEYINQELKSEYQILETEQGVIPMTNYPFHKDGSERVIKIGTAGSWVKPSSGYSFHNSGKLSRKLVSNLNSGKHPTSGLLSTKFRLYDAVFLDVLRRKNDKGDELFDIMYGNNSIQSVFRFLDEETSFSEEVSIMKKFPKLVFLKSLLNVIFKFRA